MVFARMDGGLRAACIALVVLGFWAWWPLGLAALLYLTVGRRMGLPGPADWQYAAMRGGWDTNRWQRRAERRGCRAGWQFGMAQSGNAAFDDYRAETLRRLEEEEREFREYLDRLRQARDKSEFDGFMAERRARQTPDTTV